MTKRMTEADLKRMLKSGINYAVTEPIKVKRAKSDPKGLAAIKRTLTESGINFKCELKFHPTRKWRFDVAIPDRMIAIEYEGTNSAKSRHTTMTGYAADCCKYNQAQIYGWRVLRYTALNYGDFANDLSKILC